MLEAIWRLLFLNGTNWTFQSVLNAVKSPWMRIYVIIKSISNLNYRRALETWIYITNSSIDNPKNELNFCVHLSEVYCNEKLWKPFSNEYELPRYFLFSQATPERVPCIIKHSEVTIPIKKRNHWPWKFLFLFTFYFKQQQNK